MRDFAAEMRAIQDEFMAKAREIEQAEAAVEDLVSDLFRIQQRLGETRNEAHTSRQYAR